MRRLKLCRYAAFHKANVHPFRRNSALQFHWKESDCGEVCAANLVSCVEIVHMPQ